MDICKIDISIPDRPAGERRTRAAGHTAAHSRTDDGRDGAVAGPRIRRPCSGSLLEAGVLEVGAWRCQKEPGIGKSHWTEEVMNSMKAFTSVLCYIARPFRIIRDDVLYSRSLKQLIGKEKLDYLPLFFLTRLTFFSKTALILHLIRKFYLNM